MPGPIGGNTVAFFLTSEGGEKVGKVLLDVEAKQEAIQKTAKQTSRSSVRSFASMAKGVAPFALAIAGIGTVLLGARRAVGILRNAIRDAMAQEAAVQRFNIALQSMGQFSNAASQNMQEFAKQLELTSRFSDQAILSAGGLIAQLGRIKGEELERATKGAVNLAVALNRDLNVAALIVAKAAQGSTFEMRKYGLVIDRNVPKTERFAAVLRFLETKFGGLAKDELPTARVALQRFRNQIVDLKENIAQPFLIKINFVGKIDYLTNKLAGFNKFLTDFFEEDRLIKFDKKGPARDLNAIVELAEKANEELLDMSADFQRDFERSTSPFKLVRDVNKLLGRELGNELNAKRVEDFSKSIDELNLALAELEANEVFLKITTQMDFEGIQELLDALEAVEKEQQLSSSQSFALQAAGLTKLAEAGTIASYAMGRLRQGIERALGPGAAQRAETITNSFLNLGAQLTRLTQTPIEAVQIGLDPTIQEIRSMIEENVFKLELAAVIRDTGLTEDEVNARLGAPFQLPLAFSVDQLSYLQTTKALREATLAPTQEQQARIQTPPFKIAAEILETDEFINKMEELDQRLQPFRDKFSTLIDQNATVAELEENKKAWIAFLKEVGGEAVGASDTIALAISKTLFEEMGRIDKAAVIQAKVVLTQDSINRVDNLRNRILNLVRESAGLELFDAKDFQGAKTIGESLDLVYAAYLQLLKVGSAEEISESFKQVNVLMSQISTTAPEARKAVALFQTEFDKLDDKTKAQVRFRQEVEILGPIFKDLATAAGKSFSDIQKTLDFAQPGTLAKELKTLLATIDFSGTTEDAEKFNERLRQGLEEVLKYPVKLSDVGVVLETLLGKGERLEQQFQRNPLRGITDVSGLDAFIQSALDLDTLSESTRAAAVELENLKQAFLDLPIEKKMTAIVEIQQKEKFVAQLKEIDTEVTAVKDNLVFMGAELLPNLFAAPFSSLLDGAQDFKTAMIDVFRSMVDQMIAELARLAALQIFKLIIGGPTATEAGSAISRAFGGPGIGKATGPSAGDTGQSKPEVPTIPTPTLNFDTSGTQKAIDNLIKQVELNDINLRARVELANPEVFQPSVVRSALPAFEQPVTSFDSVLPQSSSPIQVTIVANDATSIERSITSGNFEKAMDKVIRRAT